MYTYFWITLYNIHVYTLHISYLHLMFLVPVFLSLCVYMCVSDCEYVSAQVPERHIICHMI
jgi:hypothetical protein